MLSYRVSMGECVFSATCRMMEWTILLLLYRSSHFTISSGDTRRFDRSIYPAIQLASLATRSTDYCPTLLLVDTEYDDDLVAADSDKLLNTSDTSSRKLGKENHAVDIVVLEELDIRTHLGDLVEGQARGPQTRSQRLPTCFTFTMTKLSISGYFSS